MFTLFNFGPPPSSSFDLIRNLSDLVDREVIISAPPLPFLILLNGPAPSWFLSTSFSLATSSIVDCSLNLRCKL